MPADGSREVAYAILAYINAEALGEPRRPRRAQLVDQAYGHMNQWFVDRAWQGPGPKLKQFSPFMVGLTAHSLIRDWEQTRDPRLIPALRMAADWLWANAWLRLDYGMFYDALNGGTGPGQGAPDLNLLIAPMYAFLYRQTGEDEVPRAGRRLVRGRGGRRVARWRQAVQPELLVELRLREMAVGRSRLVSAPSMSAPAVPAGPQLSIVVPVRNGEDFLRLTLDSLLSQTFADFELLISDNASTDATESICREYAARDPRVQYHRSPESLGLADNFNRLIDSTVGEYFKWAAADDLCHPTYLARCVDILKSDPSVVLVCADTVFIDAKGQPAEAPPDEPHKFDDPGWDLRSDSPVERLRYVIRAGHWVNSTHGVIRREMLRRTNRLPRYLGGDYGLLGELSLLGKFFQIPEPLFFRRIHPGASSQHAHDDEWIKNHWAGGGQLAVPCWSRACHHLSTIARSDLGLASKLSLTFEVLRIMYWNRRRLRAELQLAVLRCFWLAGRWYQWLASQRDLGRRTS